MSTKSNMTYDYLCFSDLVYEFHSEEINETERKIKRRLKYFNLGKYDQERIEYIRKIKNELLNELSNPYQSRFYLGAKDQYSNPSDFSFDKMKKYYCNKYSIINESDIIAMLNIAIYVYYLR